VPDFLQVSFNQLGEDEDSARSVLDDPGNQTFAEVRRSVPVLVKAEHHAIRIPCERALRFNAFGGAVEKSGFSRDSFPQQSANQ
jgi:hypothetical protein